MGKLKEVALGVGLATAVATTPASAEDVSEVSDNTKSSLQDLVTQCDKNNDGIKGIFEKKCYLKGKNAMMRKDIARSDENIAKNREDIARLNKKGQDILDEMRVNAGISD